MLRNTTVLAPYYSKGKKISQSSHHDGLFIIDIVGTNMFYTITSSKELMLKNNPPDSVAAKFTATHNIGLIDTSRIPSRKRNKSNSPKGLADIR